MITSNSAENTAAVMGMTGSKRRSRLGLTVSVLSGAHPWYYSNEFSPKSEGGSTPFVTPVTPIPPFQHYPRQSQAQNLSQSQFPSSHHYQSGSFATVNAENSCVLWSAGGGSSPPPPESRADGGRQLEVSLVGMKSSGKMEPTAGSEGARVAWRAPNFRGANFQTILKQVFGVAGEFSLNDLYQMFLRNRSYLSSRTVVDEELLKKLDRRKEHNKWRGSNTLLDFNTSLKYAHSSLIPQADKLGFTDIKINEKGKVRFDKVAKSHSIRFDPVDAPIELFKYRNRINQCINWAYKTGLVPVMMTLTIYHRWHDLAPLCRALQKAWTHLFSGGSKGQKRREYIGLQGFVRRMEETLNDNDAEFNSGNAGWHPHYHIILFISREKLQTLSDYEEELREIWLELTSKYFEEEVGEPIPEAFHDAVRRHGLVLSRYSDEERNGELFEVKDSTYLAKIMGYDPESVYGADKEMTSFHLKNSKIPFDLLRGDWSPNKADLWCEYVLATKGIPCFEFSYGLNKKVDAYYKAHPEEEIEAAYRPYSSASAPNEKTIAHVDKLMYKFLFKCGMLDKAKEVAAQGGYEALAQWFKPYQEQFSEYLGMGMWKPLDTDTDDESDDSDTSYDEVKVSDSPSQNTAAESETSESEQDYSEMSWDELYYRFGTSEDMKFTDEESDADSDTEENSTEDTEFDLDEAIRLGIVKVTYHEPPPEPESSSISSPSTDSQAENSSDQGTSIPFSQGQESPSPNKPEKSSTAAEELAIAEKMDRPGILPAGLKLTPLVSQGLSVTEALEQVSLPPTQKEMALMMIEQFRKKFSKNPQDTSKESSSTPIKFKTPTNQELESWKRFYDFSKLPEESTALPKSKQKESQELGNWKRLSDFSRLTESAAIPEAMKEEIRRWYTQHEHEFGSSSP